MEHLWEILGYFATAVAGSLGGWLFGRKKYNTEVEGNRVQNFDAAIEAYKKMYEDMISDLKEQNGELKEEVDSLKKELAENRKQIITLTNFVLKSAIMANNDSPGIDELRSIIK